jgi:DnaK suppressor protein
MIATFLQMMGLAFGVVEEGRAGGAARPRPENSEKPQAAAAKLGANKSLEKASDRPARSSSSKPKAEGRSSAAAKPGAKPGIKPAGSKTSAKPVSKPASKPAAKAVAKSTSKATPASASKSAKAAAAPAPVVKTKTSPSKAEKPTAAKAAAPAPAKKAATKAAPAAPVAKAAPPAKAAVAKPVVESKPVAVAEPVAVRTPVYVQQPSQSVPSSSLAPPKSARASSRLAQITVPSMAQSVASTAAKASYLQNIPSPMIVSPPHMAAKKDPKLANNWKTTPVDQLTDAEVLAMPDSEYMNEKQMAFFRHKLVLLKQDMLNNAGETTEHLREDTVVVPDPADRATIEEEHALELRTRDRERKLLKKIQQSIGRIDAGDYGYCDETGEPIGVGRLLARPTATLSLEAQQRRELKQKMFGD